MQVLGKVCRQLVAERENEIRKHSVHGTQMRNELSCYSHSTQDLAQMLKKNMGYMMAEEFQKIRRDIQDFLDRDKTVKASPAVQEPVWETSDLKEEQGRGI